eukprot:m.287506 g.287506  ORF g.287506 m.287506 type:complete len:70 (-) comp19947_c0_seq3:172-381(-)
MDSSAHDPLDEEYKDLRKALQAITSAAGGLNIAHGKLLQHTASVVTTVESFHRVSLSHISDPSHYNILF